jgi:3D-(3,5/4)-trihydroxycyclohexane-1,2-dione acylhydrolase (decyclizing)
METVKLTTGQAIIKFLDNQYISFDGEEQKFVQGIFGIFGHGCVLGLGEAIQQNNHSIPFYKGCNEQGMCHAAIAFAKQKKRKQIMAVTTSVGPGAANLVTAAALATTNRIPVLLLPGDTFASRQPDPVLQQMEKFDGCGVTTNDALRPVCRYFDRIDRPEQIMTALFNAMRVLTSPSDTGAVCIALPQDVQGEAHDYPLEFFEKRIHYIEREIISDESALRAASLIKKSKHPLLICGGGVKYSEAEDAFVEFAEEFKIPFGETQAGKGSELFDGSMNLGGIGVTGGSAANEIAQKADLIIGVGSRLSDFTTCSKWLFKEKGVKFLSINVCDFDLYKMNAHQVKGDAKKALIKIGSMLQDMNYQSSYVNEIEIAKDKWSKEVDKLYSLEIGGTGGYSQLRAIGLLNENLLDKDDIIVGASGSLPGDLQRVWRTRKRGTYHMEYGYSCMGYEINGALGAKMACMNQEVYSFVGDASFVMGHSELLTALENKIKINIILFNNSGFGCIDNLQRSQGIPKFGCELVYPNDETGRLDEGGSEVLVDYAMIARGYGCDSYSCTNSKELKEALIESKKSKKSTLIEITVDKNSMSKGYNSWWRVGTPQVSDKDSVLKAREELDKEIKSVRQY